MVRAHPNRRARLAHRAFGRGMAVLLVGAGWLPGAISALRDLRPGMTAGRPLEGAVPGGATFIRVGVNPRETSALDIRTRRLLTMGLQGTRAGAPTSLDAVGGLPLACLCWNGRSWIAAGELSVPGNRGPAPLPIQARAARDLHFVAGAALLPEEHDTLRLLGGQGSCASSDEGTVLVSFAALGRLVVVGTDGSEGGSIPLPIPAERRLDLDVGSRRPDSPEAYAEIFRGRTIPVAVGWSGGLAIDLIASPGSGAKALAVVRVRDTGHVIDSTKLDVPSVDARDAFVAAIAEPDAGAGLLVLSIPYSGPEARGPRELLRLDLPQGATR